MTKILTKIFLLIGFTAWCQNEDQILFEKASALTETYYYVYNEHYGQLNEETSKIFEDTFVEHSLEFLNELLSKYPDSKFYTRALFSKAELEYRKNDEAAKQNLQQLLLKNDATKWQLSYANLYLADIYIKEKDFKTALDYLEKHAQFPKPFGCGTAIRMHESRIENLRKICSEGLKN